MFNFHPALTKAKNFNQDFNQAATSGFQSQLTSSYCNIIQTTVPTQTLSRDTAKTTALIFDSFFHTYSLLSLQIKINSLHTI